MRLLETAGPVAGWAAILGWMGFIFYVSEGSWAGDVREPPTLSLGPFPRWTREWVYHSTAFGILATIAYGTIRVSFPWRWPAATLLACTIAIVYGGLDEWHRSFVPGRSANIGDLEKDVVGTVAAMVLAHALLTSTLGHMERWVVFAKAVVGLLVALEGAAVVWIVALWMEAASGDGFSLALVCRPSAIMGHVRGVENPRV